MAKETKQEANETKPGETIRIEPAKPVGTAAPVAPKPAEKAVDKSARAIDAVDYPIIACIGCNSTNTVRIDEHLKRPYHRRQCRACGKMFKEPARP